MLSDHSKLDQIRSALNRLDIDILCLTETWLCKNVGKGPVKIPGYEFFRNDRQGRLGGGVGIYVKEKINFKPVTNLRNPRVESLWGIATFGGKKYKIASIYRPGDEPISQWDEILDQLEESLDVVSDGETVIFGDLNHNYEFNEDLYKNPIFQLEKMFDMKQLITEPTRTTESTSTLLDVIITSNPEINTHSGVLKCSLSDHDLVYTLISEPEHENAQEHHEITFRDTRKLNPEAFLTDMTTAFSGNVLDWENWRLTFNSVCDKHAPLAKQRVNLNNDPWVDSETANLLYSRDYAKDKYDSTGEAEWAQEYRT